jgi:hypothetical protein
LPIADCRLPIADCRLPIADFRVSAEKAQKQVLQQQIGNRQSAIANWPDPNLVFTE